MTRPEPAEVDVDTDADAQAWVLGLASAYRGSQAVYAAAALGIADELAGRARSASELAQACAADSAALSRLLRLLAAHGLVARRADGAYELTARGSCLRHDAPGDVRSWVLMFGEEQYRAWGELLHTIRTGAPAFDRAHGSDFFGYLARHPNRAARYHAAMADSAAAWGELVATACNFTGRTSLVDVGGGGGVVAAALLRANPGLRAVLLDTPAALSDAHGLLERGGLAHRCSLVAGDFRDEVPAGHDAYLLCRVLGDWGDEAAVRILRACRQAMPAGAVLFIAGGLSPDDPSALQAALDLHLSVLLGGGDRTVAEYGDLVRRAGLAVQASQCFDERGAVVVQAVPRH